MGYRGSLSPSLSSSRRGLIPYPYLLPSTALTKPTKGYATPILRAYREGYCVHACTLLYTRVYTLVYLRVHKSVYDRSSSSPTLGGTEGDR